MKISLRSLFAGESVPVRVKPVVGLLEREGSARNVWQVTEVPARIEVVGALDEGWLGVEVCASAEPACELAVGVDYGLGVGKDAFLTLGRVGPDPATLEATLRIWQRPRCLVLETRSGVGRLELESVLVRTVSGLRILSGAVSSLASQGGLSPQRFAKRWVSILDRWRRGGWRGVKDAVRHQFGMRQEVPRERHKAATGGEEILREMSSLGERPLRVSIVVVTHNGIEHTKRCLESLGRLQAGVAFEVIVVDNASTDGTAQFLEAAHQVRSIFNKENRHFAEACNRGAECARGEYLFFLNNDTEVAPDILESLLSAAESAADIGAVGAKLLRHNGRLQEAGGILWRDGTCLGYGRDDDPKRDAYMFRREVDYASAAGLLVERDLFLEVEGFDLSYQPAYYEDVDLCMKIRATGRRVVFDPFSEVRHHEYGTAGRDRAVQWMRANQGTFVDRWSGALEGQPPPEPRDRIAVLRARQSGRRNSVLILDDRLPAWDQGAGYPRMFQLLSCLRELGCHLTFGHDVETHGKAAYSKALRELGVEVLEKQQPGAWLRETGELYDAVLVSRPRVFEKYLPSIRRYAQRARVIYDSEALWHRRVAIEADLEEYPLVSYPGAPRRKDLRREARELQRIEFRAIEAADVLVVVCEEEATQMGERNPRAALFTIPNIHDDLCYGPEVNGFAARRDILLVGGFFDNMRSPNTDAVLYFVRNILPEVRKRLPDVELQVAGFQPPEMLKQLAGEGVTFWGDLGVEDFRALYFSCRLCVVPQRIGSGVKYKTTEAMALGLPLVGSSVGVEGTGLVDGETASVADDPGEFAAKVIELYANRGTWEKFAQGAFELARQSFSREAVLPRVEKMVSEVMDP